MYISTTAVGVQQLTPAGRRFVREFAASQSGGALSDYVLETAQAAEALLEAISRSDGSRTSVLKELRATEVRGGILGSFHFDANGDKVPGTIAIYRITRKMPPGANFPPERQGTVFDRTLSVPAQLLP
jgi:ABC-type branched-subunit amino acid transport system substrate-binding protein